MGFIKILTQWLHHLQTMWSCIISSSKVIFNSCSNHYNSLSYLNRTTSKHPHRLMFSSCGCKLRSSSFSSNSSSYLTDMWVIKCFFFRNKTRTLRKKGCWTQRPFESIKTRSLALFISTNAILAKWTSIHLEIMEQFYLQRVVIKSKNILQRETPIWSKDLRQLDKAILIWDLIKFSLSNLYTITSSQVMAMW